MNQAAITGKYRFLLIPAFRLPETSPFLHRKLTGPKEQALMNFASLAPMLDDVSWELHPGALASYGDWAVETREEFCYSAAARLPIVREACESGLYNGIVLLGGGEPGFLESREIGRRYRIPVTSCAFSQMHVATMLGNKFSVIDLAENHNMYYYNLIVQHRMTDRCASIRMINFPHERPGCEPGRPLHVEREKARSGERSDAVEEAVAAAIAAIEEDGAEVIIFGCSGSFWLQPIVEKRLAELGWEVPVLEGYRCAISLAKIMVDLGVDASGLMFPGARPRRWRKKKVF
ncbi:MULTISPECIES: aspartate/glutamate racemase family protein [unclassified Sinorhizobium]|uniref:aspartate/glutamate racemase family protein n=1 Tax=unclassified Sinorhizobium TaxID=2613772 RepID=UPI003525D7A1